MLGVVALCLAVSEPPPPPPTPPSWPAPREIYFREHHIALYGISVATALFTSLPSLNRNEPKWESPGKFDRRARNALKLSTEPGRVNRAASIASDVFAFGIPPVLFVGSELAWGLTARVKGRRARWRLILQDVAVVSEAWGFTMTTVSVIKISTARQRPFARGGVQATPAVIVPYDDEKDQNASFPSGHTAAAFSLAVAGATVASMRRYPRWRLAWLALAPAVTVPFLRIAADQHYLSDVLVGAAIGTAFGVATPLLIHNPRLRRRKRHVAVGAFQYGMQLSVGW